MAMKISPISFILSNRKIILKSYEQNNRKAGKTWEDLKVSLPGLFEIMRLNTFKQYMPLCVCFNDELDKVIQDKEMIIRELDSFKTEKEYLNRELSIASERLDKVSQEREEVKQKLHKTGFKNNELVIQLKKYEIILDKFKITSSNSSVIQKLDRAPLPKRISGWSIQKSKDGYYRCYRKINNKLHSIYIGKVFDEQKTKLRIKEKENKLEA